MKICSFEQGENKPKVFDLTAANEASKNIADILVGIDNMARKPQKAPEKSLANIPTNSLAGMIGIRRAAKKLVSNQKMLKLKGNLLPRQNMFDSTQTHFFLSLCMS